MQLLLLAFGSCSSSANEEVVVCPESPVDALSFPGSVDDPYQGTPTLVSTGSEVIAWGLSQGAGQRYDIAADTWKPVSQVDAPSPRVGHSAIWTGEEMIVWGGFSPSTMAPIVDGGRYDPSTDTWRPLPAAQFALPIRQVIALWTGQEMVILDIGTAGGAVFDPDNDTWRPIPPAVPDISQSPGSIAAVWTGSALLVVRAADVPAGYRYILGSDAWEDLAIPTSPPIYTPMSMVWTGTEVLVWGRTPPNTNAAGYRYNPTSGVAEPMNSIDGLLTSNGIWTGSEMLVFRPGQVARYSPENDTWSQGASMSRAIGMSAIWLGDKAFVWGERNCGARLAQGALYDPAADNWVLVGGGGPTARSEPVAAWTGSEMLLWGGAYRRGGTETTTEFGDGVRLTPDGWAPMACGVGPVARADHTAVWSGSEFIIWGGNGAMKDDVLSSGARYTPANSQWATLPTGGAPTPREDHSAIWTGTDMIIWGGLGKVGAPELTGGIYSPSDDLWTATATSGAPTGRQDHTAVWTGSEMIVWGGWTNDSSLVSRKYLSDGGRYDPATDSWSPMSTAGAPSAREDHTAIWTGSRMIVFGGRTKRADAWKHPSDIASYDPETDQWSTVAPEGAPAPRAHHTALWTGTAMLIWGGFAGGAQKPFADGASYDPESGKWEALPADHGLAGRARHAAVWTGEHMLIWGGESFDESGTRTYFADGAAIVAESCVQQ